CAADLELRVVLVVERGWDRVRGADAGGEFERAVEYAGGIVAGDDDGVADSVEQECFLRVRPKGGDLLVVGLEQRIHSRGEEDLLVTGEPFDGLFETLGRVELARRCTG